MVGASFCTGEYVSPEHSAPPTPTAMASVGRSSHGVGRPGDRRERELVRAGSGAAGPGRFLSVGACLPAPMIPGRQRSPTVGGVQPGTSALQVSPEGDGMRQLRYSINVTLDGCCHHDAGLPPDQESMRYWTAELERADALIFGRVTYGMMQSAWRRPTTGSWPEWMGEWDVPFTGAIHGARKHVVSSSLSGADAARRPPRARPARARGSPRVPVGGSSPAIPAHARTGVR